MDASQDPQATSISASEPFYCEECKASFSGQKELDRHKRTASAHCPDKIPCYYPGCSKPPYQKQETVHTHVGRDHRDEIEALLCENNTLKEEVQALRQLVRSNNYLPVFYEPQHSPQYTIPTHTGGAGVKQPPTNNIAPPPFTMHAPYGNSQGMQTYQGGHHTMWSSPAGIPTASSLPRNTSQPITSSTPAQSYDNSYPMPATSASSYPDPTGQLGDNPQDLQAYGTRASYSNPFLGTPDTILDEDAEFSHDGYIQPGPGF